MPLKGLHFRILEVPRYFPISNRFGVMPFFSKLSFFSRYDDKVFVRFCSNLAKR